MALPKTFTGGERLFAEDLNDNFSALDAAVNAAASEATNASNLTFGTIPTGRLPAGVPVRVFNSRQTGSQTVTSGTWVDVTNGSITIAPLSASNKIFIIANSGDINSLTSRGEGRFRLLRGSTVLATTRDTAPVADSHGNTSIFFMDEPNTTGEVTYKLQIARADGNVVFGGANITVMEIAG